MNKNIVVEVQEREGRGKNASGRLRREGGVPGVLYGLGRPPHHVAVASRKIEDVLRSETGRNTIFTLALAGQDRSRAVMIKDLQRHPVTERLVHVDFVRVDLDKAVRVKVPIRLVGIAEGVKTEGGILEFVHRTIEVECLPADIPEHLDVDVSGLHLNQNLSVSNIPFPEKVKVLDDPETIVCVVAMPKEEAAPVAEEAADAAAEPEVIKKGKEAAPEDADKKGGADAKKAPEAKKPEAKKA
ncbi:MAG TPA: 50S ribosomal protein L25 [Candidatus Polarisedimenticolaceae bacterium]|nr:50S ribosomal protein L25 [Candidatus Polarisedimenticolaceae bacterium]